VEGSFDKADSTRAQPRLAVSPRLEFPPLKVSARSRFKQESSLDATDVERHSIQHDMVVEKSQTNLRRPCDPIDKLHGREQMMKLGK
jgi:hypothetical protein